MQGTTAYVKAKTTFGLVVFALVAGLAVGGTAGYAFCYNYYAKQINPPTFVVQQPVKLNSDQQAMVKDIRSTCWNDELKKFNAGGSSDFMGLVQVTKLCVAQKIATAQILGDLPPHAESVAEQK